jgi:hypothetical protein
LRDLYKYLDIVANINNKRMEQIGHLVSMDQGRTPKKVFEGKSEEDLE